MKKKSNKKKTPQITTKKVTRRKITKRRNPTKFQIGKFYVGSYKRKNNFVTFRVDYLTDYQIVTNAGYVLNIEDFSNVKGPFNDSMTAEYELRKLRR